MKFADRREVRHRHRVPAELWDRGRPARKVPFYRHPPKLCLQSTAGSAGILPAMSAAGANSSPPRIQLSLFSVPRTSLPTFSRCANTINAAPPIAALIIGAHGTTGRMNTFCSNTNNGIAAAARIDPSET